MYIVTCGLNIYNAICITAQKMEHIYVYFIRGRERGIYIYIYIERERDKSFFNPCFSHIRIMDASRWWATGGKTYGRPQCFLFFLLFFLLLFFILYFFIISWYYYYY